jgi:hypothetical protein
MFSPFRSVKPRLNDVSDENKKYERDENSGHQSSLKKRGKNTITAMTSTMSGTR